MLRLRATPPIYSHYLVGRIERRVRGPVETSRRGAGSSAPWFLVVSEMLMAPPAAAVAGAVSAETAKSGPILMMASVECCWSRSSH